MPMRLEAFLTLRLKEAGVPHQEIPALINEGAIRLYPEHGRSHPDFQKSTTIDRWHAQLNEKVQSWLYEVYQLHSDPKYLHLDHWVRRKLLEAGAKPQEIEGKKRGGLLGEAFQQMMPLNEKIPYQVPESGIDSPETFEKHFGEKLSAFIELRVKRKIREVATREITDFHVDPDPKRQFPGKSRKPPQN